MIPPNMELKENEMNPDEPQLKLLLLSHRLTTLKRQREYNIPKGDEENLADAIDNAVIGKDGEFEDDDDECIDGGSPDRDDARESMILYVETQNDHKKMNGGGVEGEGDEDISYNKFGLNGISANRRLNDVDGVETGKTMTTREQRESPIIERLPFQLDLSYPVGEEDEDDDGTEERFRFKAFHPSNKTLVDNLKTELSRSQPREKSASFSRLAEDYLNPEFLHDIRKTGYDDVHADDNCIDDCLEISKAVMSDDDIITRKIDSQNESSSDEKKRYSRKKSATKVKSAKKPKLKAKVKLKHTISSLLLEVSEDAEIATMLDGVKRSELLFHRCVCAFPWRCASSSFLCVSERLSTGTNPPENKKGNSGGKVSGGFSGSFMGWMLSKDPSELQRGGRNVSSARESNRRRKYDPFSCHRNNGDSSKYAFKHYQDWQCYVDEYRRDYTVNQTGMGMNSRPIPEGGGRREAVVIVRTMSENLRPRLQDCNFPDWDDFTDLSATSMRPLHMSANYRSGKLPDLGVTWLSAAASAAHHHDAPLDYRYPASRHVKLTTLRHPGETVATLNKKRQQSSSNDYSGHTRSMEAIAPHDGGVTIPAEPMHIVEDFRRSSKKDQYGADMRPIGYRFVASWRPNDSTRVKSANADSKRSRSKGDAKLSDGNIVGNGSVQRGKLFSKQGPLKPLMNGNSGTSGQSRTGLLKLFMPPRDLDMYRAQSEADCKPQKQKSVSQSKCIDVENTVAENFPREHMLRSSSSSAAKSVDVLKWITMPSRHGEGPRESSAGNSKNGTNKQSPSKSRASLHADNRSVVEKRSATKSGALARRPVMKSHFEDQTQKELLHVRGENKQEKLNGSEQTADVDPDQPAIGSSNDNDGEVFGKARIKLVAPYAQPLSQDNVLVGSPYGTSPHFRNDEPSATLQSTG